MSDPRVAVVSQETAEMLKKFKFRKSQTTDALILKIDKESLMIYSEGVNEDVSLADLRDLLPEHQPRYILLSYRYEKEDGRVTFPYCMIFSTPEGSPTFLKMLYAASISSVSAKGEVTKVIELRDVDDLSDEWLQENLN